MTDEAWIASTAAVAGTATNFGGGKSANGAVSGSYGRLYNEEKDFWRKILKQNPLPGAPITEKHDGTADGRFSAEGEYRVYASGKPRPHLGVDLAAPVGTPVLAAGDGTVSLACIGTCANLGNVVYINHASALQTRYAHLDRIRVSAESRVTAGMVIGFVGRSEIPARAKSHLHFEVRHGPGRIKRAIDPNTFFQFGQ